MGDETYLGDGLYASFDGYQFRLRAPHLEGDHVVYLDNNVLNGFVKFIEQSVNVKFIVEEAGE